MADGTDTEEYDENHDNNESDDMNAIDDDEDEESMMEGLLLMLDNAETPSVGNDPNWLRVALIGLSMVGDAFGAINMLQSNYYYYNSAKHITKFISATIVLLDESL